MNRTKKYLIIIAIVFSFLDIGWQIFDIVTFFTTAPQLRYPVFYLVLNFITIIQCIAVITLLIMAIWKNGDMFRQRYGFYMTAIVISIIINLFSVSSILLIISMFVSDWVWIKEDKIQDNVIIVDDRQEKIAQLRKQRENGEISEEEFQERLLELL